MKSFYSYIVYCYKEKSTRTLPKMDGVENLGSYAGYINKGDKFPLTINFENDIIEANLKTIDIVAKKKIYFMVQLPSALSSESLARFDKHNSELCNSESDIFKGFTIYLSNDAENWAYAWDWKGLKKAFGIGTGTFSYGVGISQDEGLTASLGLSLVTEK
jgi:hypothetical protein